MNRSELVSRLRIDKHSLDTELIEQSELYYIACEQHVIAVGYRETAKEEQKRVAADLYVVCRKRLAKEDGGRVTEARINAEVELHPKFVKARDEYLAAGRESDLWLALKEAMMQRSYALKDLCGLFMSNYFQDNSVRGESAREVSDTHYRQGRADLSSRRRLSKR